MVTSTTLVELQDVEYTYPSASNYPPALKKISLKVHRGEIVRITGRNGSGKTTLLKIIANKLLPTRGVRKEKRTLRSVYLDQNASEFVGESLTVCEQMIIGLGSKIGLLESSRKKSLREQIFNTTAHYNVGLESKLDTFTAELSGGQRQIVALLSVLLGNAELLVLDEFAAAMDPISTKVSNNLIQTTVNESRIGVVFVNHAFNDDLILDREIRLE